MSEKAQQQHPSEQRTRSSSSNTSSSIAGSKILAAAGAIAVLAAAVLLSSRRSPTQLHSPSLTHVAAASLPNTAGLRAGSRKFSASAATAIDSNSASHLSSSSFSTTARSSVSPPAHAQIMLADARLTPRRSGARGHSDHGWLNTYHTFSFADYWDPAHMQFGSVRVLNEDRVAPGTGFPTHPHRDAEIFSYIVSGELTHRDSMVARGREDASAAGRKKDDFYRMHRGDVQFTTGGSGIAHSEQNEHKGDWVHFLQIWALPWRKGLTPRYHTRAFDESEKRSGVVPILSPLRAGIMATEAQEEEALPSLQGTIPIHADLVFSATVIPAAAERGYAVGATDFGEKVVTKVGDRRVYVHLIMTNGSSGKAKIRVDGREELSEGDGCYIENVKVGDRLRLESVGSADAELILLDSD